MKGLRYFIILFLAVFIGGCVTPTTYWASDNPNANFERDKSKCIAYSNSHGSRANLDFGLTTNSNLQMLSNYSQLQQAESQKWVLFRYCMMEHGWYEVAGP
jgi:hypothetical protein